MYTTQLHITESQLDVHGCWRLSSLLAALQDAATVDAASMNMERDRLLRDYGAFWIVSRTSVWLDEPIGAQTLTLTTWHAACRGASWTRCYTLRRGEQVIARASSIWASVSWELPRRLVRLDPVEPFVGDTDVPMPAHIRAQGLEQTFSRIIRYSDLDQNAHLNNARAVDLALDALDFGASPRRFIREAHLHYAGESLPGDELSCFVGSSGALSCFEARTQGKPAFCAALQFDTF